MMRRWAMGGRLAYLPAYRRKCSLEPSNCNFTLHQRFSWALSIASTCSSGRIVESIPAPQPASHKRIHAPPAILLGTEHSLDLFVGQDSGEHSGSRTSSQYTDHGSPPVVGESINVIVSSGAPTSREFQASGCHHDMNVGM